jgi:serpin B
MGLMNSGRAGLRAVTGATITGIALIPLMLVGAHAQNDDRKSAQEIAREIAQKVAEDSSQNGGRTLTDGYNASGFALFRQLSGRPGNIVLSPLSIGTAMAMALSGARGETEREMASVLKQSLDRSAMEAANGAVLSGFRRYDQSALAPKCPVGMEPNGDRCEAKLPANGQCAFSARREGANCVEPGSFPPSARLLTANALMLTQRGDLVAADYAALLRDKYGAEVFHNVGLDDVNGWVKRKTEGKIERILDRLDSSSPAVILNAVYFKAKWAATFSKASTTDDVFNLSRQKKISVPMMRRVGTNALVTRPLYRAIRLPYEVAPLGMVIVLPNEPDGLDAVARQFDSGEWAQLAGALRTAEAIKAVDLAVPRFKASLDSNLAPLFKAAGMIRAFRSQAGGFQRDDRPPARGGTIGDRLDRASRRHRRHGGRHRGGSRNRARHRDGKPAHAAQRAADLPRRPAVSVRDPRRRERCNPVPGPHRRPAVDGRWGPPGPIAKGVPSPYVT